MNSIVIFCKGFLDTQPLFGYMTLLKPVAAFKGQSANALIGENKLPSLSFEHHVTVELTW